MKKLLSLMLMFLFIGSVTNAQESTFAKVTKQLIWVSDFSQVYTQVEATIVKHHPFLFLSNMVSKMMSLILVRLGLEDTQAMLPQNTKQIGAQVLMVGNIPTSSLVPVVHSTTLWQINLIPMQASCWATMQLVLKKLEQHPSDTVPRVALPFSQAMLVDVTISLISLQFSVNWAPESHTLTLELPLSCKTYKTLKMEKAGSYVCFFLC